MKTEDFRVEEWQCTRCKAWGAIDGSWRWTINGTYAEHQCADLHPQFGYFPGKRFTHEDLCNQVAALEARLLSTTKSLEARQRRNWPKRLQDLETQLKKTIKALSNGEWHSPGDCVVEKRDKDCIACKTLKEARKVLKEPA